MEKEILICKCGHLKQDHFMGAGSREHSWCWQKCFMQYPLSTQWQHNFKLDNLTLIEKLAEAKGLI